MVKVRCQICGEEPQIIASSLLICPDCVRKHPDEAIEYSKLAHSKNREVWHLPPIVPSKEGRQCHICSNECSIKKGEIGYCGIRINENGRLHSIAGKSKALLHTYLDPLPTNCCSTYFCPGGPSSTGYPRFAYEKGAEYGYYNYACFLYGCNFSCLGCQNDQHRGLKTAERYTFEKFTNQIKTNPKISCICWFGGSPEPQLPWALRASKRAIKIEPERIMRVCWEWNGAGNKKLVQNAVALSLETGGNAKFDLKYSSPVLSQVLSGVSNERSFTNFEACYNKFYQKREENPVLTATTLLVPGYMDKQEVAEIVQFIASLNKSIPYSLLIFHPDSFLLDLPVTPRQQVKECYEVAKSHLDNVHLGNKHLLGFSL